MLYSSSRFLHATYCRSNHGNCSIKKLFLKISQYSQEHLFCCEWLLLLFFKAIFQKQFCLICFECAKFRKSRAIVGLVGLVPPCYRAFVSPEIQIIFSRVFHGSQMFFSCNFVGSFILVGILWVQSLIIFKKLQ